MPALSFRLRPCALLLVVVALAALTAGGVATAQQQTDNATGTVVADMIHVQGVVVNDPGRAGQFDYLVDVTASQAVGDYRLAAEGEQTYVAVDATTNGIIGVASTDADGVAVLDGEVGAPFYVYEIDDVGDPFGSTNLTYDADQTDVTVSMTGVAYVDGGATEPTATAVATNTPNPPNDGAATGTVVEGQVTIQGLVMEDPDRAGEFDYERDATQANAVGNYRVAREGEQTYEVRDLTTDGVIDSGSTGPDGRVTLNGEVDAGFYVVETSDTGAIPGTATLYVPSSAADPSVVLYVVAYVASLEGDVTPTVIPPSETPITLPTDTPAVATDTPVLPAETPTAEPPSPTATTSNPSATTEPTAAPGETVAPDATATVPSEPTATSAQPIATDAATQTPAPGDGIAAGSDDAPTSTPTAGAVGNRTAAPVQTDRDDVSTLPNTGAGQAASGSGGWQTTAIVLVALLAMAALGIAAIRARFVTRR